MAATCPNCGAATTPELRFCLSCGTALAEQCPTCSTPRVPGARFCGQCGTSFEVSASPTLPDVAGGAPQTERRLVSVLFADLVGFTTRSETLDPEEVRDFLTRYFETASQVIARYGGTVEKFIGDAVMAVWGTPTSHEDDSERAVRAALDLVEAIRALGGLGPEPVAARAGVMTGEAAVSVGATGQGMVAGDLVNTCSRLQAAAEMGTVLVDEATQRAAARAIAFEQVGDQTLRGRSVPIPAWRALRVVAERGGVGRSEGLEPPFIAREEELRLLKEQVHTTGREGKARLVTILGEAGMGKSRLLWELLKYIDGVTEDIYWHHGRSPAYGDGIAYWALGEMVRRRAGIAESEEDVTAQPRLSDAVAQWIPDQDDRVWVEPRLAALLGMADAPAGEREELFAAWRLFFERIAERGTTVLAFEDLHWADQGLLDFIESVLEWSRTKPILVIALARPELMERRPTWGMGGRASVTLHLDAIDHESMATILRGVVPGLPATAVAQIADRSEGVPLFAVETVRMLLDDRRLVREGERYRLLDADAPFAVPPSLQALIAARLDAVDPDDRSLMQDAAVIGRTFSSSALAAVSGRDAAEVERRMAGLARKELVELDTDPRSPEHGQWGFVHGLFREIAYGTLSRRDRRTRHLAAAHHFEAFRDDELAGVVASHYLDAYRAAPEGPEGAAVADQARVALRAAADRALSLRANASALGYIEQALSVATDEDERAALLLRAADPADALGRPEAEVYLRDALAWYGSKGDVTRATEATVLLGRLLLQSARLEEATTLIEAAVARLPEEADPRVVAQLSNEQARAYCFVGRAHDALAALDRGLELAERAGLDAEIAELFITKAWAVDKLGRAREASLFGAGGLEYSIRVGNFFSEMRARMNLSNWLMTDEPRRGLEVVSAGLDLARRIGHDRWALGLAYNRAVCALLVGDWDETLAIAAELERDIRDAAQPVGPFGGAAVVQAFRGDAGPWIERFASLGEVASASESPQDRQGFYAFSALVSLGLGDLAATLAHARQAVTETEETGEGIISVVFATRAALAASEIEAAEGLFAKLARRGDAGAWLTAARRGLAAGFAATSGDRVAAEALYRESIASFRSLAVPLDLAWALSDLAVLLGPGHRDHDALASEAEAILERLRAPGLLGRLHGGPTVREDALKIGVPA